MWGESMQCNKTPVTILQEFLQQRKETPTYDVICNISGTHENLFKFKVTACNLSAIGTGKSKKESKHDAAKNLLSLLQQKGILHDPTQQTQVTSPYEEVIKENTIGQLHEFCITNKFEDPKYETIRDEGLPHDKVFGVRCTVSTMFCDAEARTKKQAKHLAAKDMLKRLMDCSSVLTQQPGPEVSVTDSIFKKVTELGTKKAGPTVALGKNLSEYCNFMKQEVFPCTDILDTLKTKSAVEITQMKEPLDLLKTIVEEMDTSMEVEESEYNGVDCMTLVTIKTTPQWIFFGMGNTKVESERKAILNSILFLRKMSM